MRKWRNDLRWGVFAGLGLAAFYTAIALAIYLIEGARPFDAYGVTVGRVILGYWVAGVVGGFLIGLGAPLVRNTFGSIVLGILVAIPTFAVITVASGDLDWGAAIVLGVFFGTVGGVAVSSMGGPSWDEMSQLDETIDRISAGERDEATLTQFRQQVRGLESNSRDASEPDPK